MEDVENDEDDSDSDYDPDHTQVHHPIEVMTCTRDLKIFIT